MYRLNITVVRVFVISIIINHGCAAALAQNPNTLEIHKNCASLSSPGHYPDYKGIPHYSIVKHDYSPSPPTTLQLRIAVSAKDLDSGSMTRLACQLGSRFPKEARIDALVFDEASAAKDLAIGMSDQRDYGKYLWHLRAHYVLDKQRGNQYIELVIPDIQDGLLFLKRVKVWLDTPQAQRSHWSAHDVSKTIRNR